MISTIPPGWAADVLHFWFEQCTPEQWFKRDDAFDQALRQRFLPLHASVAALANEACLTDAGTALAATIVLDQFSRNMFRGTPAAFAQDPKALAIAQAAIARGFDTTLPENRRQFFYLPFEHSEDLADQEYCIALMSETGDADLLKWAKLHADIIRRFGRFPHRNQALGRATTAEEQVFLDSGGFGG